MLPYNQLDCSSLRFPVFTEKHLTHPQGKQYIPGISWEQTIEGAELQMGKVEVFMTQHPGQKTCEKPVPTMTSEDSWKDHSRDLF